MTKYKNSWIFRPKMSEFKNASKWLINKKNDKQNTENYQVLDENYHFQLF